MLKALHRTFLRSIRLDYWIVAFVSGFVWFEYFSPHHIIKLPLGALIFTLFVFLRLPYFSGFIRPAFKLSVFMCLFLGLFVGFFRSPFYYQVIPETLPVEIPKPDKKLLSHIHYLSQNDEHERAIQISLDLLRDSLDEDGRYNLSSLSPLNELIGFYAIGGQPEKATEYSILAAQVLSDQYGPVSAPVYSFFHRQGQVFLGHGFPRESALFYEKALEVMKELVPEDSLEYAVALNNLGNVMFESGEVEKSKNLLTRALMVRKARKDEVAIQDSLYNLTVFYLRTRKCEMARLHFDQLNTGSSELEQELDLCE